MSSETGHGMPIPIARFSCWDRFGSSRLLEMKSHCGATTDKHCSRPTQKTTRHTPMGFHFRSQPAVPMFGCRKSMGGIAQPSGLRIQGRTDLGWQRDGRKRDCPTNARICIVRQHPEPYIERITSPVERPITRCVQKIVRRNVIRIQTSAHCRKRL